MPFVSFHAGVARPYEMPPPPSASDQSRVANSPPLKPAEDAAQGSSAALRRYEAQAQQASQNPQRSLRDVVAGDIMSQPVQSLPTDASVASARALFRLRKFRYVPVVSHEDIPVGMLTDRDTFIHATRDYGVVGDIMRGDVITATPETSLRDLLRVMVHAELSALPITDAQRRLVGIITTSDILRTIEELDDLDLWA